MDENGIISFLEDVCSKGSWNNKELGLLIGYSESYITRVLKQERRSELAFSVKLLGGISVLLESRSDFKANEYFWALPEKVMNQRLESVLGSLEKEGLKIRNIGPTEKLWRSQNAEVPKLWVIVMLEFLRFVWAGKFEKAFVYLPTLWGFKQDKVFEIILGSDSYISKKEKKCLWEKLEKCYKHVETAGRKEQQPTYLSFNRDLSLRTLSQLIAQYGDRQRYPEALSEDDWRQDFIRAGADLGKIIRTGDIDLVKGWRKYILLDSQPKSFELWAFMTKAGDQPLKPTNPNMQPLVKKYGCKCTVSEMMQQLTLDRYTEAYAFYLLTVMQVLMEKEPSCFDGIKNQLKRVLDHRRQSAQDDDFKKAIEAMEDNLA